MPKIGAMIMIPSQVSSITILEEHIKH